MDIVYATAFSIDGRSAFNLRVLCRSGQVLFILTPSNIIFCLNLWRNRMYWVFL